MAASNDRAEALRRLAELGAPTAASSPEPAKVTSSGEEVYAGGKVARLLVKPAHLTYREDGDLRYAFAEVGDTILVTAKQAKRLDGLKVTVDPDTVDDDEVEEEPAPGDPVTDDQLIAMSAAELVAHAGQHPGDRARIRALEEARSEKDQRKTVLEATDPEADAEAEAQGEAQGEAE